MTGQEPRARRGQALLTTLLRLNRTGVFLGALAVAVLGMFLPSPIGPLILYVLVAGLAALQSMTWSVTPPAMRAFRLLVVAGLAAIATTRLLG